MRCPFSASLSCAAEPDLKPGDTIGPQNWERVKGMVEKTYSTASNEAIVSKSKTIAASARPVNLSRLPLNTPAKSSWDSKGELLNYAAGQPFPNVDSNDPQAGLKMAWNFYWRWIGDDSKTGGGTGQGKIIRYAIERDGSERRADVLHHSIKTRGRVSLSADVVLPGYEHIDWMQLRADEYPRDTSGTTTLEIRYASPDREDDLYIYVPSIRRVRRAPPIQRCATSPLASSISMISTALAARLLTSTIGCWEDSRCWEFCPRPDTFRAQARRLLAEQGKLVGSR